MQLSVEGGAVSYTQAKDAASRGHLRGVNSNVAVLTTGRGGGTQRGSDVLVTILFPPCTEFNVSEAILRLPRPVARRASRLE